MGQFLAVLATHEYDIERMAAVMDVNLAVGRSAGDKALEAHLAACTSALPTDAMVLAIIRDVISAVTPSAAIRTLLHCSTDSTFHTPIMGFSSFGEAAAAAVETPRLLARMRCSLLLSRATDAAALDPEALPLPTKT
jgi:hypothetical protein